MHETRYLQIFFFSMAANALASNSANIGAEKVFAGPGEEALQKKLGFMLCARGQIDGLLLFSSEFSHVPAIAMLSIRLFTAMDLDPTALSSTTLLDTEASCSFKSACFSSSSCTFFSCWSVCDLNQKRKAAEFAEL
jgi:hypothetical protein